MADLTLPLFFAGAIVFVPNVSVGPETMTAYLVKSDTHVAYLSFEMKGASKCPVVDFCKSAEGECFCYLNDVDLSFVTPSSRRRNFLRNSPPGEKPSNVDAADDFSWLLRIKNVHQPSSSINSPGEVEDKVDSRLDFTWVGAQSCHLDQKTKGGDHYLVHRFEFVDKASGYRSDHVQALAESARFDVRFQDRPIRLVLNPRAAGAKVAIAKIDCPAAECPSLLIANQSTDKGDEDYGYHVEHYYKLAKGTSQKLIPHQLANDPLDVGEEQLYPCKNDPLKRLFSLFSLLTDKGTPRVFAKAEDAFADVPDELKLIVEALMNAVDARAICPMAIFEP